MYAISADIHAAIAELCREYRVKELSLFGSAARDDFRPESDIDLLYVFEPDAGIGFFALCDLQDKLAALFGRKVDLVPKEYLKPAIRPACSPMPSESIREQERGAALSRRNRGGLRGHRALHAWFEQARVSGQ